MEHSSLLSVPVVPTTATTPGQVAAEEPLACAECGHYVEPDEYRMERTATYPLGGCSAEGKPLCAAHRVTRCTGCAKLLPRKETHRVVLRWHPRVRSFFNLRPHWEEVFTRYCSECAADYRDPRPPDYYVTPLQVVVLAAIAAGILLLAYVIAFNKLG